MRYPGGYVRSIYSLARAPAHHCLELVHSCMHRYKISSLLKCKLPKSVRESTVLLATSETFESPVIYKMPLAGHLGRAFGVALSSTPECGRCPMVTQQVV